MAGPNIDSPKGIDTTIPSFGVGSKTPTTNKENKTELGGAGDIKNLGLPGAPSFGGEGIPSLDAGGVPPKSPEEQAEDDLLASSTTKLTEDIIEGLGDSLKEAKLSDSKIEKLVNHLLDIGWTAKTLKKLIRKSKLKPKEFFRTLAKKINSSGEEEAINFLKERISPQEEMGLGATPVETPIGKPPIGGPTAPPPLEGIPQTTKANLSDVDLDNNFNNREAIMNNTKIVVKEGTLTEVPDNTNNVLNDLVVSIRKTKSAINSFEDKKLKYAGSVALRKFAIGEDDKDTGADIDEGLDIDEDEDIESIGEENEDLDIDKEQVLSGLDAIRDGISSIEDAIKGVESEIESPETEMGPGELGLGTSMIEEGEKTIAKAREILKSAKRDIEAISGKPNKKKITKKMDSKMNEAIMGGKGQKLATEEEKDDEKKDDSSCDSKDGEGSVEASEHEDLIKRVKARLADLRKEKEAQLYPFENIAGPAQNVDNTNATTAKQQDSTINSEIKKQPVQDKDNETINPEIGQKDLPYKQEGKNTTGKDVPPATSSKISMETAEKTRAYSIKNAVDKAKLSVELAAQQQLKGLLDNPLKKAFIDNMKEVGIPEDTANAIAHNAFVDGYEANQQIIMKEAFDTFMNKPIDDFVKVAKFTKEHIYKEASIVENTVDVEDSRDKTSSVSPPLRGAQVTGSKKEVFTKYWEQVGRERRGF